jgi:Na+/H+-dicarboxylate symporter
MDGAGALSALPGDTAITTRKKPRLSVSSQVLLGLVLGMVVGVCFGELTAFLQEIGKAFILLLQMTVLPYIMLSLITGLGRLDYAEVKTLVVKVGGLLVGSWGLAGIAVLLMPLAFPAWESASFFSTSLIEPPAEVNFLTLFIPANPFYSLAFNIVPAVVLFSIAVGIALIGVEQKHGLLEDLTILNRAMTRVTHFVSRLTPFGVFAVVASAAGTMSIEEFGRLQIYLILYVALALLLTFWVLPALITSSIPLPYRVVVGETKDILVTAFATGSALIVLPLLVERSKELLRQNLLGTEDTEAAVDVIIPACTSFPKIGTLLPMSFVLFAGWFSGASIATEHYPTFLGSGLVSFFGSVNVAIPLLLDLLHLPADLFQLYLAIAVVTDRFAVLLTTMNNLLLTLVGACAVSGLLTVRWSRLLRNAVITFMLMAGTIGGTRVFFAATLHNEYRKDKIVASMQLLRNAGPATVHLWPPPPRPLREQPQTRLERIRTEGILRVGYFPDSLPFTYFNAAGQLVGLNAEMAYALARELDVKVEFIPVRRDIMAEQLHRDEYDIVMAPVAITPERAQSMAFSVSYMDQTMAFVVKDHRRQEFSSWEAIRRLKAPLIGILNTRYYIDKVRQALPYAALVILNSPREFFENRNETLDAFVFPAEAGSAWSLLYPAYTVVIPQPDLLTVPLAYPMARGDPEFVSFINTWIELKKKDKTLAALYDYWILGKNVAPQGPRWSVLRNVLHWVR